MVIVGRHCYATTGKGHYRNTLLQQLQTWLLLGHIASWQKGDPCRLTTITSNHNATTINLDTIGDFVNHFEPLLPMLQQPADVNACAVAGIELWNTKFVQNILYLNHVIYYFPQPIVNSSIMFETTFIIDYYITDYNF